MVASFVAIIAFVVLVLVNNVNTAYNAYSYVAEAQSSAPYEHFAVNVDRFVRKFNSTSSTATLIKDDNAIFLTNTIDTLNGAIDYFADYLSVEGELSKGEQADLIKSYKNYEDAFARTRQTYNDYIELLSSILGSEGNSHVWNDYERQKFSAQESALVLSYYSTYQSGSIFFRDLLQNVKTHAMTSRLTFNENLICLKVYFADRALNDIFSNGVSQLSSTAVADYGKILEYSSSTDAFSDKDLLTNSNVMSFVDDASSLDLYRLVNNYLSYLDGLEDKGKAIRTYNFIQNNILA